MEIKRTEKAFQITGIPDSEINSTRTLSTFSTSDSFESANSDQSMFTAPQPESPLDKASVTLEKQFNATRLGQSLVGTSSPQPVSRANDKQAEFTKAHSEFQQTVEARQEDALQRAAENALDGLRSGNSSILGGEFTPVDVSFLDTSNSYTNTDNSKPENSKPKPVFNFEVNQKQKFFNDLLESNRLKPTSSVEDERIKNVKDHNNVPTFFPPTGPTSRANDRQAEFTEAKAEFERTSKNKEEGSNLGIDIGDFTHSGLDDLGEDLASLANQKSITVSESNRKQKELSDLMASTREALGND